MAKAIGGKRCERRRNGRSAGVALTACAALFVAGAAAYGASPVPPPLINFDPSICVGHAARHAANGRLLGQRHGRARQDSLYTVRPNGKGLRRIARYPRIPIRMARVSPDGRRLVVHLSDDRVLVRDLSSGRDREITDPFHSAPYDDFWPTWSPDGRWITLSHELAPPTTVLIHPDGTGAKPLDTGLWAFRNGHWSPNGRCLAGTANYRPDPGDRHTWGPTGYALVRAGGGAPNVFLPDFCPGSSCTAVQFLHSEEWTPDGRTLFTELWTIDDGRISGKLVVRMGLLGRHTRVFARNAAVPVVSPDGRYVAVNVRRGTAIYTIRGRRVRLLRGFGAGDWMPRRR